MKIKSAARGFVLAEFAIALPLLILLLGALGMVTVKTSTVSREQAADYALETEAQYVLDRITADARVAHSVKVERGERFDRAIFYSHALGNFEIKEANSDSTNWEARDILDPQIYIVASPSGGLFHVYRKRRDDNDHNNPLIGENSFGKTYVTKFRFSGPHKNLLHITIGLQSKVTGREVELSTSVFMPACENFDVPSNE